MLESWVRSEPYFELLGYQFELLGYQKEGDKSVNAEDIVKHAEAAYNAEDLNRIMQLFDPEVVFFWNGQKKAEGLDSLRRWHESWVGKQKNFTMRKTLRAASGNTIAVEWRSSWTDEANDSRFEGYGGEFWTMRNDRLVEWHAYHVRHTA